MSRLSSPTADRVADLDLAISRRRPATRRSLTKLRPSILEAYDAYPVILQDIRESKSITEGSEALAKALRGNFELLNRGRPLEALRNAIFVGAEARNYQCPLCDRAQVCALDHFLPKDFFPEYSIYADNLIPTCERCNRLKGSECDRETGLLLLHAYFDDPPSAEILFVDIEFTQPISVSYRLRRTNEIAEPMFCRIERHFDVLQLFEFYRKEAIAELVDQMELFSDMLDGQGEAGLRMVVNSLLRGAEKRGTNHWRAALYRALVRNAEFCAGTTSLTLSN